MPKGDSPNSLRALQEHGNKHGQRNAEAVAFARELRSLIVEHGEEVISKNGREHKRVEKLIEKVWDLAISGKEWAVQFIADRVEGKVTQPISAHVETVIDDIRNLSPDERAARIAELERRRRDRISPPTPSG